MNPSEQLVTYECSSRTAGAHVAYIHDAGARIQEVIDNILNYAVQLPDAFAKHLPSPLFIIDCSQIKNIDNMLFTGMISIKNSLSEKGYEMMLIGAPAEKIHGFRFSHFCERLGGKGHVSQESLEEMIEKMRRTRSFGRHGRQVH